MNRLDSMGRRLRRRLLRSIAFSCVVLTAGCHADAGRQVAALPNVQLIDDHGSQIKLGSLSGKLVLLDFIHIGCPGVCASMTNKFGQVADGLGSDLGSKVVLLTITNDPEHDGPQQLLSLARSSEADLKGWLFATGDPKDVARVIQAFGLKNDPLPDGSNNHITRVFLLGPDGRKQREYQGLVMDSHTVLGEIKSALSSQGAS
jgi:cytochrome oxidase Cu insertion factor (SCO1/SenC/PrrC family)